MSNREIEQGSGHLPLGRPARRSVRAGYPVWRPSGSEQGSSGRPALSSPMPPA